MKQASTTVHYSTRPSYSYDDKPIKGKALGVLIVFLLSIIGFILVYVIGDEEAKQGDKNHADCRDLSRRFLGYLDGHRHVRRHVGGRILIEYLRNE